MDTINMLNPVTVRSVLFKEEGMWFGVVLELNIVEAGVFPEEVSFLLDDAIRGYVEAAHKANLSHDVFDQDIDPEYLCLWNLGSMLAS